MRTLTGASALPRDRVSFTVNCVDQPSGDQPIPLAPYTYRWTRDTIARFWSAAARMPHLGYFGHAYARTLTALARPHLRPGARVLDYGCGGGHLLERLLEAGYQCQGADYSPSPEIRRLYKYPGFRGVELLDQLPSGLQTAAFEFVFFVETIEHLLEESLVPTLAELHRVTAPGGIIMVTTPDTEELIAAHVLCPNCGALFHPMQHVRSWTPSDLSEVMAAHGFEQLRSWSFYVQPTLLQSRIATVVARIIGKKTPNLLYIGRKMSGAN